MEMVNSLVHMKEQSVLKKNVENNKNRPINHDTILVQTMPPRTNSALADRSVTDRKKKTEKNKLHIFVHTASARSTIFPKFCMVIEDVETILKVVNHFSIQCIVFFLHGAQKNSA